MGTKKDILNTKMISKEQKHITIFILLTRHNVYTPLNKQSFHSDTIAFFGEITVP